MARNERLSATSSMNFKGGIQNVVQMKRSIPYSRFSAAEVTEALGLPPSERAQYTNRQYINHLLWAEYCLFSNPDDLLKHPPYLSPGSSSSSSKNTLSKILYSLHQLPRSTSGEKVFFVTSGGNRIWRPSEQTALISDGVHTLTIDITKKGGAQETWTSSEEEGEQKVFGSGEEVFRFRAFSKKPNQLSSPLGDLEEESYFSSD
mmetsp:Transcript_25673/g.40015  ORF Transcript_25673/g.40015 Transcript_25673/m.40015 type:complete len:204 (-) Transcript_25673:63-674(-)